MSPLKAIHAGNRDGALAALAALEPAARRKLAPEIIKLHKHWNKSHFSPDPNAPSNYRRQYEDGSDEQRAAALASVVAVVSPSELATDEKLPQLLDPDSVVSVAKVVRPHWLHREGLEVLIKAGRLNWRVVEALVRADLCERPQSDGLIESLIESHGFRSDIPLTELVRAEPRLIADGVLYRLFEVEGGQQSSLAAADKYRGEQNQWATVLYNLTCSNELDRPRVLDATLDALARDFAPFRANWFARFHDKLAPTETERQERADRYLRLLGSSVPATVGFAVKAVDQLFKVDAFQPGALLDAIPPALQARQKGTVKRAAKLLQKAVKLAPGSARSATVVAIDALVHPDAEVQGTLLDVVDQLLPQVAGDTADLVQQLANARSLVAPSLRERLPSARNSDAQTSAGTAQSDLQTMPLKSSDPFDDSYRLDYAQSHEEALDMVAHALERTDDAMAQECALDAIARYALPTDNWDDLAGPLRKRARHIWSRNRRDDGLQAPLTYVTIAWTVHEKPAWSAPLDQDPQAGPALQTYRQRCEALADRVLAGKPLPLLSTPTHRGGFIQGTAFASRVAEWKAAKEPADVADALLSLMRLPPGERKAARRQLELSNKELEYALDLAAEAQQDTFSMRAKSRKSGRYTFCEIEVAPENQPESTEGFRLRHGVTNGDAYHEGSGDEGGMDSGGDFVRWTATVTPDTLAPHFAQGVRYLGYHLNGTLANGRYLEPALLPWVELGLTGHWLLLLALAARGARAVEVGIDVAIDAMAQGRVRPELLADALGEMMPNGILKAKRLATTLTQVAAVSPEHADAVCVVIAGGLRGNPEDAPRDIYSLLELLHELLVDRNRTVTDNSALRWLEGQPRGGKVAKLRKAILTL